MRILVEVLHPAHVHVFRNAIGVWQKRGDEVLVLSRKKEVANELLAAYGIPFESISELKPGKLSLLTEMVVRDVRMLKSAQRFKPDVLVGVMGVTIVQVGLLLGRPAVVFYDTENAKLTNGFVYPLAHSVCTPDCYEAPVRGRHVVYPSYHELAYLHPNRFTPDPEVVRRFGVDPSQPFFLVRFVSWQASHDVGEQGFDLAMKQRLIQTLSQYGRVLISSEAELPSELESLRFRAPPEQLHHFIAFAKMLVGESATMASEAAVLGVPAFYIADTGRGYTNDEEKRFGLVFNYKRREAEAALQKVEELLRDPELGSKMRAARERLLAERIDLTGWMVNYIDSVVSGR
jgi:uncharacterized protein